MIISFHQDYNAKLSDFGLAKDGPEGDATHVSTRIMGTHGYAAPEYVMTGTEKHDFAIQTTLNHITGCSKISKIPFLLRPFDYNERRV